MAHMYCVHRRFQVLCADGWNKALRGQLICALSAINENSIAFFEEIVRTIQNGLIRTSIQCKRDLHEYSEIALGGAR